MRDHHRCVPMGNRWHTLQEVNSSKVVFGRAQFGPARKVQSKERRVRLQHRLGSSGFAHCFETMAPQASKDAVGEGEE